MELLKSDILYYILYISLIIINVFLGFMFKEPVLKIFNFFYIVVGAILGLATKFSSYYFMILFMVYILLFFIISIALYYFKNEYLFFLKSRGILNKKNTTNNTDSVETTLKMHDFFIKKIEQNEDLGYEIRKNKKAINKVKVDDLSIKKDYQENETPINISKSNGMSILERLKLFALKVSIKKHIKENPTIDSGDNNISKKTIESIGEDNTIVQKRQESFQKMTKLSNFSFKNIFSPSSSKSSKIDAQINNDNEDNNTVNIHPKKISMENFIKYKDFFVKFDEYFTTIIIYVFVFNLMFFMLLIYLFVNYEGGIFFINK